ncbi:hypothetical protein CaCOL14_003735 [Colletotrichum acutatum]
MRTAAAAAAPAADLDYFVTPWSLFLPLVDAFADPTLLELPSDLRNDNLKLLHTEYVNAFPDERWMDDGRFECDASSTCQSTQLELGASNEVEGLLWRSTGEALDYHEVVLLRQEFPVGPFDIEDDFNCTGSILLLHFRPGRAEGVMVLMDDDRSGKSVGPRCQGLQIWDDVVVLTHAGVFYCQSLGLTRFGATEAYRNLFGPFLTGFQLGKVLGWSLLYHGPRYTSTPSLCYTILDGYYLHRKT